MTAASLPPPLRTPDRLHRAGFALGFGLGGFLDGILLHQVLQWHHLLSGLDQARADIRFLILTDGLFHVLMYIVSGAGLWLLWKARNDHPPGEADKRLLSAGLFGFGGWHILDSILSHWILGIHRIRMDSDNPLAWDLLWFLVFGLVPVFVGWLIRRTGVTGGGRRSHAALLLCLAVGATGPIAALPAPQNTTIMVLFAPGTTAQQALASVRTVDGKLVWMDQSQTLVAVDFSAGGDPTRLYRHGALLVTNSIVPLGCFNWIKA